MLVDIINIFILLLVGYLSSQTSLYFKIPAGRLIGPIIAIASLKILGLDIIAPGYLRTFFSIVLGIFIGLKFTKQTVDQLKSSIKPCFFVICWYLIMTIIYGYLLKEMSILDEATAFLSVIPGGIAEVNILAVSYNANMAQITSFQLTRLLTIVLIVPLLAKKVISSNDIINSSNNIAAKTRSVCNGNTNSWWFLFIIGGLGSAIFSLLNCPAGNLIGALVFIAIFNFTSSKEVTKPPTSLYNLAQIGMGGIIGTSFYQESLQNIGLLVVPIVLITFFIILNSLILAWIFSKIFKWRYITSFLGVIPGGLTPMVLIAGEINADIVIVSSLQMVRLLTAILFIPLLYTFFLG